MEKNNFSDEILNRVIPGDNPGIEPNPSIIHRLNYHFLMKNSSSPVKKNSMLPFFGSFMMIKSFGIKAGLASAIIASFLFVNRINNHQVYSSGMDTCSRQSLMVDTNYMIKDSCK